MPCAILFDLFGTLIHQFPLDGFRESLERMSAGVGVDYQRFHDEWTGTSAAGRFTGAFGSLKNEVAWICERCGVAPPDESLEEAVRTRIEFIRTTLVPRSDAVSTLEALRERGVLTALVSNCSIETPTLWPKTPFAGLFDAEIFSCSVGVKKPDPAIYRAACDALGVVPEECWFIGDGFGNELHGARDLGMRPFLLLPPDEPRPTSKDWEGHDWDGETVPSLASLLEVT